MMYRWCAAPTGERVYGRERFSEVESEMSCACSQKRWELSQSKVNLAARDDVSLHCSENGNYESLQCDAGLCWCADQAMILL